MAEYNLFLNAEVNEANRKLDGIDKKLDSIDKKAGGLNIEFPNLDQVVKGFKAAGDAIKFVWDQSDGLLGSINPLWGALGDIKDILGLLTDGAEDFGTELQKLKKVMPTTIVGTAFEGATAAINNTAQATARLGYVFFGLQQSVNLVSGTFNAFFDSTIARQAELEAAILRTRTTLASTTRVLADGMELRDPLEAIEALEGPIDEVITNIRRRSLEIAGTTSEAIIQTFGVVAASIGQVGGSLQDAEDLAISFAAALGTIGLSNPMYATQEIRSILSGNIDQNSVLARSLGITNEDIQKAKTSAEGLVGWLEKRLAAFGAGQKLAATQLSGVLSNVLEVWQEFSRELGKPLLEPILNSINAVFGKLSSVFKQLLNFAEAVGFAFTKLFGLIQQIVASSDFNIISDRSIAESLDSIAMMIGEFAQRIARQLQSYIVPMMIRTLNNIKKIIDDILPSVLKLVAAFAQFQIARLEVWVDNLEFISGIIAAFAPLINNVLNLYSALMSNDLVRYFVQLGMYVKIFEENGVNAFLRLIASIGLSIGSIKQLISFVTGISKAIKTAFTASLTFIKTSIKTIEVEAFYLITKLIQMIADLGIIIATAVQTAAIKAKVALVEVATQAQASGTAMGNAIAQAALVAAGAMDSLAAGAVKTKGAMDSLSKAAPDIADKVLAPWQMFKNQVKATGTYMKTKLVAAFAAVRTAIWSTIKGMAIFSLQMAAVTLLVGAAVQAWSKWKEGVQRDTDIREGIRANEQLASSLKNVTDESSAFMKAQKKLAEQQRDKAMELLAERATEATKRVTEARKELEMLQSLVARGGGTNAGYGTRAAAMEKELEKRIKALNDYKNQLEDLARTKAAEEQRKEDERTIAIMAKERTGLEKKVAKEREKIERELEAYYFRIRQNIERNIFQEREAKMRVEMARIAKAQELAKDGMTGVARTVADIIDDYQNEMNRIENERIKREFDLKQQIAQLAKNAADYEFKLKELQAKIAKQVGNFNVKVADYQTKMARRRHQEEMEAAIKANKLRTTGFSAFGDEAAAYKNTAAQEGLSATNLLSFLYAGGAEKYGIGGGVTPEELTRILRDVIPNFDEVFSAGNLGFNEWLDKFAQEQGKAQGVAAFAREQAQQDLGTIFKQAPPPAPPRMEKLDLAIQDLVEMRRAADKQLTDAIARLNKTMDQTAKAIAGLKLKEFGRRSMLTDLPTQQSLAQQQGQARLRLMGMQAAGAAGGRMDPMVIQKTMLDLNKAIAQAGIDGSNLKEAEKAQATRELNENFNKLNAELPATVEAMKKLKSTNLLIDLEEDIIRLRQQGFDTLIEAANSALVAFASFGEESERRVAQVRIENELAQRRLEFLRNDGKLTEEAQDSLKRFREELEKAADAQDELRKKLEPLYEKLALAKDAAATLTEAYKNAAKSLLAGGDIKEISRNFAQALAGKTIDSFVEWVFKDMQKQLEEIFGDVLGLGDVEEQIKDILQQYVTDAETDAQLVRDKLSDLGSQMATEIQGVVSAIERTGAFQPRDGSPPPLDSEGLTPNQRSALDAYNAGELKIGDTVGGPEFNGQGGPSLTDAQLNQVIPEASNNIVKFMENAEAMGREAGNAAQSVGEAAEANATQATTAEQVQGALAGATQMLLGIGMVASGISQIQEGGTSNTLLGIGQVLMGVGSFGLGIGRMFMAQGAYVNSATPAMIGDGGTPEYVIPENKMNSSMTRWAAGMRGKGVVEGADITSGSQNRSANQPTALGDVSQRFNPGNNYSNTNNYGADGAAADNFSINITGEQLVFNEKNYVSQDQIPSIVSQASKQGEARTLRKIRMSQSTRSRAGI